MPRNDEIKPRNKFAALLAVIQQQYTDTTLEQWDADDTNQAQSIISGLDLPHERENLAVFCPHIQRNTCLETQWRLKSTAKYYELKTNQTILEYLQRHRIFMNPTGIKQTAFFNSRMSSSTVRKMQQQRLNLALTLMVLTSTSTHVAICSKGT